ncbi:phage terminase small subunit-related protein [Pelosinus propionicus]|uniref:Phage terminase small subunit n=1 Tax=Pelosinus propionicus DSM 13327 TaxID=1123291 RepID=A0A1I4P2A0_9FIRM|nr:phage terminase small subunit-related protein [Pelosinus propionicus]SFM21657.1 Phage terminase small subunit [Pelosinus propionicus DSM 13327]
MARPRNPDRDKAFEIWLNSNGTAKLKDIAAEISIPDSRIRKWKTEDNWDQKIKERSDWQ